MFEHRVVQQHGDRLSVARDECRAPPAVLVGKLDRLTVAVDVMLLRREPERELQRRVAQRAGERLAQVHGGAQSAQLDDEPGDRPPRQPSLQEHEQHRDRHGCHQGEVNVGGKRAQRSPSRSKTTVQASAASVAHPATSTGATARR